MENVTRLAAICLALAATTLFVQEFAGPRAKADASNPSSPAGSGDDAVDKSKALHDWLPGTKWLWYGKEGQTLEFLQDGKVNFDAWSKQGINTHWTIIGEKRVKLLIVSGKFKGNFATLDFNEDRTSFSGTDIDRHRKITPSPRVGRVADPSGGTK